MTTPPDKTTEHVDALLSSLRERLERYMRLQELADAVPDISPQSAEDERRDWAERCRGIVNESVGEMVKQVNLHAYAILKISSDDELIKPVRKLARMVRGEIAMLEACIALVESGKFGATRVIALVGRLFRTSRQKQIAEAIAELEHYRGAA